MSRPGDGLGVIQHAAVLQEVLACRAEPVLGQKRRTAQPIELRHRGPNRSGIAETAERHDQIPRPTTSESSKTVLRTPDTGSASGSAKIKLVAAPCT